MAAAAFTTFRNPQSLDCINQTNYIQDKSYVTRQPCLHQVIMSQPLKYIYLEFVPNREIMGASSKPGNILQFGQKCSGYKHVYVVVSELKDLPDANAVKCGVKWDFLVNGKVNREDFMGKRGSNWYELVGSTDCNDKQVEQRAAEVRAEFEAKGYNIALRSCYDFAKAVADKIYVPHPGDAVWTAMEKAQSDLMSITMGLEF
ncbi:hypothetical protein F5Y07DRAFT_371723 [Xylaria sp. FL0933]|nr:hypothetical protein F5Y07DRAFT_371723 [Xylaria sp. FL0933]